MTKRLILMRHAKSSWDDPLLADHERILNARGRASATAMGDWLRDKSYIPDQILCSAASRTLETCDRLALDAPVTRLEKLYLASADQMLRTLAENAAGQCVLIIAHNPGCAELAENLVTSSPDHARFFDYPTNATLVADFDIDTWGSIKFNGAKMIEFTTPRDLIG